MPLYTDFPAVYESLRGYVENPKQWETVGPSRTRVTHWLDGLRIGMGLREQLITAVATSNLTPEEREPLLKWLGDKSSST